VRNVVLLAISSGSTIGLVVAGFSTAYWTSTAAVQTLWQETRIVLAAGETIQLDAPAQAWVVSVAGYELDA
jgi:hypothetical protein